MDSNPLLKLYQASRAVNKRKQMAHHANRRNYVNYETTSTMSPYRAKPFHGHSGGGGRNGKERSPGRGGLTFMTWSPVIFKLSRFIQ